MPAATPPDGVQLAPLRAQDVTASAALHLSALPPSFFSSLGRRFLRRYHASYVASPHGIALAATSGGQLCGFVVGSSAAAEHSRWVVRHRGARLALAALLAMAVRPRALAHFASSRLARYGRGVYRRLRPAPRSPSPGPSPAGQPAVLAHIAVGDAWRGQGVGELLVRAFEQQARAAGAPTVQLVTLEGPGGAGRFYERLGYTATGVRQDDDGRRWQHFRRTPAPG